MTTGQKTTNTVLWIAQILLAAFMLTGTFLKFQPIDKVAEMMPWTGQVPEIYVRLLGIIDLLGGLGLILPALLRIRPLITPLTALLVIALMICAIIFHVSRGEASVTGANVVAIFIAAFIAWGRYKKVPVTPR